MHKTRPRKKQIRPATLTLVMYNRKQNHELRDLFRMFGFVLFLFLQLAVPEEGQ